MLQTQIPSAGLVANRSRQIRNVSQRDDAKHQTSKLHSTRAVSKTTMNCRQGVRQGRVTRSLLGVGAKRFKPFPYRNLTAIQHPAHRLKEANALLHYSMIQSLCSLMLISLLRQSHSWLYATQRQGFLDGIPSKRPLASSADADALVTEPRSIYSMPALYDLAFGYRDYSSEVDFLLQTHQRITGTPAKSVVELASGPSRHSITAVIEHESVTALAIDLSFEMVDYARNVAREELPSDLRHRFHVQVGDMRSFQLDEPVDAAWILLGSLQHLTENQEIMACLRSIHANLVDGGTLIVELPHPRETFSMVECTRNGWKVPLEDENGQESGQLEIVWGDEEDDFDPIRQVRQFTVAMELQGVAARADVQSVREIVPLRLFTAQEMDLLAQCTGFKVAAMCGALEEGVEIDDDDAAFRMVCVLQKIETGSL